MVLYPLLLIEKDQGVSCFGKQLVAKKYEFAQRIIKPNILCTDYLQVIKELSAPGSFFKESEKYTHLSFRAKPLFSKKSESREIGDLERNIVFGSNNEENSFLNNQIIKSLYNELRVQVYSKFVLKEYESQQLALVINPEFEINPNPFGAGTILNIVFKYDSVLIPDKTFNQLNREIFIQRQSLIDLEFNK